MTGAEYIKALELEQLGISRYKGGWEIERYYEKYKKKEENYFIHPLEKEEFEALRCFKKAYLPEACFLWKWKEGYYVGVYLDGIWKEKVFLLNPERPIYAPVFESIESFLYAIEEKEIKVQEFFSCSAKYFFLYDYPAYEISSDNCLRQTKERLNLTKDKREQFQLLYATCLLTPREQLEELMPYLKTEFLEISFLLCDIIQFFHYKEAYQKLSELLKTETKPELCEKIQTVLLEIRKYQKPCKRVEGEGSYIKQAGSEHFGIVSLRIEPIKEETFEIVFQTEEKLKVSYQNAVEKALKELKQARLRNCMIRYPVRGVKILVTKVIEHPNDSKESDFYIATVKAWLNAIKKTEWVIFEG